MNIERSASVISSGIFAIGAVIAAFVLGISLKHMRESERFVSVRGVSEREVKADLAIWSIHIRTVSDSLSEANVQSESNKKTVLKFLSDSGIHSEDIVTQSTRAIDRQAADYAKSQNSQRYMVENTILIRSNDVDAINKISQMTDKLSSAGVALSSQPYDNSSPHYLYTHLNTLKPAMMSEATKAAFDVARQFATDSGSNLGSIRKASQGLFSISDRDSEGAGDREGYSFEQRDVTKKVRVVVTVDYLLN